MKPIKVLSLFDGMSGGQESLNRLGIPIEKYYASEINENSIKVTQNNYPDTIQLGDIRNWKNWDIDWSEIDILMGGSPCQGFSVAGKKLNFEDERSKLFFYYLDILNFLRIKNPQIKFLLENVKMPPLISNQIDKLMGVKGIILDSRYFSGMIRKRTYWTNIPINPYEKKNFVIEDLIEKEIPYNRDCNEILNRTKYQPSVSSEGIITINPRNLNGKQTWQRGRIYDIKGACPTICATLFDLCITKDHKHYRKLTISECETLQGFPKGYTSSVRKLEAGEMLGNAWNVDTIIHILKSLIY